MIGLVGGSVYTTGGMKRADVWWEGRTVVAIGDPHGPAERIIDASGMLVGPGFVDLHTHLRDPGQTWKEDLTTGTRAAAAGGFTAVVAMPNTEPATDDPGDVDAMSRRAAKVAAILVAPAAAITEGRAGSQPVDIAALHRAGVRIFTDDGDWVADAEVLDGAMRVAAGLPGALIAQHAEDTTLSNNGHLHAGEVATSLGLPGIPAEAEHAAVSRDLIIAERTGAAYHVQHVSSAATLAIVRDARAAGVRVTVEVTPHHLDFDASFVSTGDPAYKMYPPLRDPDDRHALRQALIAGEIDVVATDHAPHTSEEKSAPFPEAPRGVIGLETAASAVWALAADPELMFAVLSVTPARLAGLVRHGRPVAPGSPANLVVFDPDRTWTPEHFASRSSNSPYRGREMRGIPALTVYEGRLVHALEAA